MKPSCDQARLLLSSLLAEPVDAAETEALGGHLADCEGCRRQAEALFRQDRALTELMAAEIADVLVARIRQELRSTPPQERGPGSGEAPLSKQASAASGRSRFKWAIGLAASVALAFGIWHLTVPGGGNRGAPRLQSVEGEVYLATPTSRAPARVGDVFSPTTTLQTVGEESLAAIVYLDGTRLDVGPDSALTELSDASAIGKRVSLTQGSLTAEVSRQRPGRPMILATPQAEVVVLGTKFSVSGSAEGTHVETAEGVVQLTRTSDGQSVEVAAGFDVVVLADNKPLAPHRVLRFHAPRFTIEGYSGAAFSSDGRTLATWSPDRRTIALWDADTGQPQGSLREHAQGVSAAAFSADGRILAAGDTGSAVHLWDAPSTKLLATLDGHQGTVTNLAFSADGTILNVLSGENRMLTRWRLNNRQRVGTPKGYPARVVAFSPDGKTLATTNMDDATVTAWDIDSGEARATFPLGSQSRTPFSSLAFSPDSQTLAASSNSSVLVWELPSGRLRIALNAQPAKIHRMAFTPDGTRLALRDGVKVSLWDMSTGTRQATFQGLMRPAGSVEVAPDGKTLATCSGSGGNGTVKLWDLPRKREETRNPKTP